MLTLFHYFNPFSSLDFSSTTLSQHLKIWPVAPLPETSDGTNCATKSTSHHFDRQVNSDSGLSLKNLSALDVPRSVFLCCSGGSLAFFKSLNFCYHFVFTGEGRGWNLEVWGFGGSKKLVRGPRCRCLAKGSTKLIMGALEKAVSKK